MPSKKILNHKKNRVFPYILFVSDTIAVILAFLVAYFLRDKGFFRIYLDSVQPLFVYIQVLPFTIILFLLIFFLSRLYEPKQRATRILELYSTLKATTAWALLLMAGSYLSKKDYSRIIIILFYITTVVFSVIGRLIVRKVQKIFNENGYSSINIGVIGTGRQAKELATRIEKYSLVGYNLVGFIGSNKKTLSNYIGPLSHLNHIIEKFKIDEIYIADPSLSQEKILSIVANCPDSFVKFKVVSDIFELVTGNIDIANLESIPSLDLSRMQYNTWKTLYRRVFDIITSTLIFLTTIPLWVCILFAIKLDSKGSAIFSQKRIGYKGKAFYMYKFRTMTFTSQSYQKSPRTPNDPRITPIGRFLRSTSLDELPQLINVIKGEMSIVGPRPEMPFIVKNYNAWEKRRLDVKPGITGLWQILGRKDLPLSENLEYDFYYINNQSFLLDFTILLKTIPVIINGKGAY